MQNPGREKRAKRNEKEEEKPKEVVLVRARRGQATDSHSLAERVHTCNSFPFSRNWNSFIYIYIYIYLIDLAMRTY